MFGAKGSVKNRIYQFWLIRMWRKRRKKKKEEQLFRRKQLEEKQKRVIEEVIGVRDTRKWKLSPVPTALCKKESPDSPLAQKYPLKQKCTPANTQSQT